MAALAAATLRAPREPERVLEIDCGDGEGVLFLAREYPRARVRGIDPSEQRVRRARERIGLDPEGRVAFKVGRRRSLPFPDDHFDLVAQREGRLALREVARVLRGGGGFIIYAGRVADPLGMRLGLLRRRLAALGFEAGSEGRAEDGRFLVARLRAPGGRPASD
jgi:ubiquinone/menaquinone biosynthesis C-methylase UbiE